MPAKRYRIAIVTSSRQSEIGGRETYVGELVEHLRRRGHVVTLFSARERRDRDRSTRANRLPARIVATPRYDVTVGSDVFQHLFPLLFLKLVKHVHSIDVVNAQEFGSLSSDISLVFSLIFKKPFLLTIHNPFLSDSRGFRALFSIHSKTLGLLLMKRASKLIVVSRWVYRRFVEIYPQFKDKFIYIANAVSIRDNIPVFYKRLPYVLSVGRSVESKNFEFVLESMPIVIAGIPSLKLFIVGPTGNYARKLSRIAANLGIDEHVTILPSIPRHQTSIFYMNSKIFAYGSSLEANATVILESMAHGIPVVTARAGDAEEVVEDGSNGYVVDSPVEMGKRVLELLSRGDLYIEMAHAARRTAERYSWNDLAARYEEIYDVISRRIV